MATYQFPDRFKLTRDQNRRFARSNIARLVYVNSRFEGIRLCPYNWCKF